MGGVLNGYGNVFDAAGKEYGIDPTLLAAISAHETGNGTSNAAKSKYNVGGMMGSDGLMSFNSLEDGIYAMARNLKRNYFDQGLTNITAIQKKYAPIGAENDPNGLNNDWVNGVSSFYNKFNS